MRSSPKFYIQGISTLEAGNTNWVGGKSGRNVMFCVQCDKSICFPLAELSYVSSGSVVVIFA